MQEVAAPAAKPCTVTVTRPVESAVPRLTRRQLLQGLGYSTAAIGAMAATPAVGLLDGRTRIAADAPAIQYARVAAPTTAAQRRAVAALDDTHRRLADGGIEVLLRPGDAQRLRQVGVAVDVLDADLLADRRQRADRPVGQQPGERDDYRHWEDFEADLRDLVARFPRHARILSLPHTSLLGHHVFGIEIATDVAREDGRPVVHVDGMHHSREWPAAEMPIMWAHDLLENYDADPRITHVVDNARTIIIPNLNPDGFIRSRESHLAVDSSNDPTGLVQLGLSVGGLESYWRKNLRNVSGRNVDVDPLGQPGARYGNPDAYGIDLNRNYGFLWGDDEGSSGLQADQTYRGTAPYSEPEARNVRWSFLRRAPITAITHHTSGEIMLHPWGRDPDSHRSRDWQLMNDIGLAMATSNGYEPKQSFGLYPTSGTSRDWGHAATSTLIWTFEHGTEFHGPYADTVPAMYEKNRGAFLTHAERAIDPATHLIVRGEARVDGTPVPARVVAHKQQRTPVTGGTFVDDPVVAQMYADSDGFTFHLPPSTRPFLQDAPHDLGDTQIPTGNPYPGGPDPVLESHGLEPGTEPYVLLLQYGDRAAVLEVTGGRGEVVDIGTVDLTTPGAAVGAVIEQVEETVAGLPLP